MCGADPSGGINTLTRPGFCSDPASFTNRTRAQRLLSMLFLGLKVDLPSLLCINLTATAIHGGELLCLVIMDCNVDC